MSRRTKKTTDLRLLNAIKPGTDKNGYEYSGGNRHSRRASYQADALRRRLKRTLKKRISFDMQKTQHSEAILDRVDKQRARTLARKAALKDKPTLITRAQARFRAWNDARVAAKKARHAAYTRRTQTA